jgi:hypothetical protein
MKDYILKDSRVIRTNTSRTYTRLKVSLGIWESWYAKSSEYELYKL